MGRLPSAPDGTQVQTPEEVATAQAPPWESWGGPVISTHTSLMEKKGALQGHCPLSSLEPHGHHHPSHHSNPGIVSELGRLHLGFL